MRTPEGKSVINDNANSEEVSRRDFLKISFALGSALLLEKPQEAAALLGDFLNKQEDAGEKGPKFHIDFFLSWHNTSIDKAGLAEKIKNADIFSPEGFGWNEERRSIFDQVSKGAITPQEVVKKFNIPKESSFMGTIEALYNTHVRVEMLDLGANQPLTEEVEETLSALNEIDPKMSFSDTTADLREKFRNFATAQVKREQYIVEQFFLLKEKIARGEIPEIKENVVINVLFAYGAMHTSLASKFRNNEFDTQQGFRRLPVIFPHAGEAIRRYMMNKNVSETLITQALISAVSYDSFLSLLPGIDSQLKSTFIRKVIDNLPTEELPSIFEEFKKRNFNTYECREVARDLLHKAGIHTPLTVESFNRIISKIEKTGRL